MYFKHPPLDTAYYQGSVSVIVNPKMANRKKKLLNPNGLISDIRGINEVVCATPLVNTGLFYNSGKSHIDGRTSGVNTVEADSLFDIQSTMIDRPWG